jgi:hypothetical protein
MAGTLLVSLAINKKAGAIPAFLTPGIRQKQKAGKEVSLPAFLT